MMTFLNKKVTLVLIFTSVISGLLLVEPCMAPITVPEQPRLGPEIVSVVIDNNPLVIPPGYYTDPYTGETYQISTGRTDPRGNVTITIKNRPFTPYTDENGNYINTYYTIWWEDPFS